MAKANRGHRPCSLDPTGDGSTSGACRRVKEKGRIKIARKGCESDGRGILRPSDWDGSSCANSQQIGPNHPLSRVVLEERIEKVRLAAADLECENGRLRSRRQDLLEYRFLRGSKPAACFKARLKLPLGDVADEPEEPRPDDTGKPSFMFRLRGHA
jgi:hypothetical protein